MAKLNYVEDFDHDAFNRMMVAKQMTRNELMEQLGCAKITVDRLIKGQRKPTHTEFKLMLLVFGCEEKDLTTTANAKNTAPSADISALKAELTEAKAELTVVKTELNEVKTELKNLVNAVNQSQRNQARLSAVIMDTQRTAHEAKAGVDLTREEITACTNKFTSVSSNTAKIYGMLKEIKEGANKK